MKEIIIWIDWAKALVVWLRCIPNCGKPDDSQFHHSYYIDDVSVYQYSVYYISKKYNEQYKFK